MFVFLLINKEIDEKIKNGTLTEEEKTAFPVLTGTLVVYTKRGEPFGKSKTATNSGLSVEIPTKWQNKKDFVIVCEYPNFTIGKDNTIILNKPDIVEMPITTLDEFTRLRDKDRDTSGYHMVQDKYGIPNGKATRLDKNSRHINVQDEFYIGPLVRDLRYDTKNIDAGQNPSSFKYGVIVSTRDVKVDTKGKTKKTGVN